MPDEMRQATGALGGATRWANARPGEAADAMAKAREALRQRYLREADPDGDLPPEERERKAEAMRRKHMARMTYERLKRQRERREAAALDAAAELERELQGETTAQ
ncbi:hypothetical protein [Pseudonocardia alni]|uniref:Uncharacterized protein n=1 Tax=Pseudonocardia alni TaxID=33907 RepID=A0A852VWH3_PSEA5|nr:hypothetical protein [Pseudonocardia antarctica]NYG00370.1 hypothetical protein [Pseudonocardia antarctica]